MGRNYAYYMRTVKKMRRISRQKSSKRIDELIDELLASDVDGDERTTRLDVLRKRGAEAKQMEQEFDSLSGEAKQLWGAMTPEEQRRASRWSETHRWREQ